MMPAWLSGFFVDSAIGVTLVLLVGWAALRIFVQPAWRRVIGGWTLYACVLVGVLTAMPGVPRPTWHVLPRGMDRELDLGTLASDPSKGAREEVARTHMPEHSDSGAASIATIIGRWIFWMYLAGVAVFGIRLMCGIYLVRRLIRKGQVPSARVVKFWTSLEGSSGARLRVCAGIPRPVTAGMFDVWVLIPPYLCEGECEGELEAVLLHELAHVKGRDTFLLFVASVLRVFLFVHPLYWLLWKDLRLNQELLADAWAAQRVGSAATYAERLVRVAQHSGALISWTLPVLQAIRRRSEFYQRMDYLLRRGQNTRLEVSRRTSLGMAGVFVLAALAGGTVNLRAIERPAGSPGGYTQNLVEATEMEGRGLAYLRASQEASGGWRSPTGPGVTGLAVRALVQGGDSPEMPHIQRALTFIERMHQSDGGYYSSESPTYNTAIIISMLAVLPGDGYRDSIERGRHFLTEMQMPARSSNFYGSRQQSASMSTERLPEIDALSEAGVRGSKDAQSMLSPLFIHSPGDRADGTVLSGYGTLTYVQLKSLLYSGVAHDDPRVQALVGTVRANFRFDTNPIYDAPQGQFYFYYAASKALRAYGDDKIIDGKGISHAWRSELADRLAELQETNGSWVNRKSDYWLENDPVLVTIYSILALQEARR